MILRAIIFSILLSSVLCKPVYSQEWIRVYGDNISVYPHSLIETYDKGYLYGGTVVQGQIPKYGWIFKTDINGEMIWDKKFGEYGDVTAVHDIQQTTDGGYILIGDTRKLDPYYDPFVMKLNACGEKEWCKILHLPNNMDFGSRIVQLPNGYYVALLKYFSYNFGERIWLMCFDEAGNILWKKVYAQDDPYITNENGYGLLTTSDSSILITSQCYYPDLPDTTGSIIRNFLIKSDFYGNEEWICIWGSEEQFYGYARSSAESKNGNIFTVGRHLRTSPDFGYSATLLKTNKSGEEIAYQDLKDNTQFGFATTINWFEDSTLAIGVYWDSIDVNNLGVIKVDILGNIIKTKVLKAIVR
jgi:hypothetical protein